MPYRDPDRRREAVRANALRHYYANPEPYKQRARAKSAAMKSMVEEAKNGPCMDCRVSYPPYVMDFDHRGDDLKVMKISTLVTKGNLSALLAEMAKCDLVCSNCHRERTHRRAEAEVAGQSPKLPPTAFDSLRPC